MGGGAGSFVALAKEPVAAFWGAAELSAGATAVATCAEDGAEAAVAAETDGATEPGFRRAAISTTVQRRWGSRCKQRRTISRKRAGKVSGTTGSCGTVLVEAGRCCVRASMSVMPSDQMSPAGEMIPFAISGASYGLG